MDAQTYAARFESMRKQSLPGATNSKRIIVVHKELDRQCKSTVARHKSDTGIVTSELRREQKSLEARVERMRRDRERCRREGDRTRRYLTDADRRHRDAELRLAAVADRAHPDRVATDAERRAAARQEAESLLRSIERLVMPAELKTKLMDEINVMYGYLCD